MKKIDKWSAEKCDVVLHGNHGFISAAPFELGSLTTWTLSDARCREIVREHFKLETLLGNRSKTFSSWICEYLSDEDGHLICGGRGETIEAAELACIAAIMET